MVRQIGGDPEASKVDPLREYRAGEVIFRQGDSGHEMFIVQDGQVEIVFLHAGGKEDRLAVLEQGDFFGEMAVLEGEPRTAGARALTACRVLSVGGATFTKLLQENPEIAVRMMRKLSSRLRHVESRGRDRSDMTLRARITEAPPPAEVHQEKASTAAEVLVLEVTGATFPLAAGESTTVGRPDSAAGSVPDIDLTDLNSERTVSRRHARLLRRDGRFFLTEEAGTMNGTFVNGQRIDAGNLVEIQHDDEVAFGAVKLRFRAQ
ncbi:MAG TPA: cyclic nucleotide-binding domain-containing protein [Thermoanaerobaculia bacterium]|nr:cyclic nucleotide-binding domain-containing protein [Thermoanaerobaculia bacterium]